MKTTVIFQVNNDETNTIDKVETDLPFDRVIDMAIKKIPMAAFDTLYIPQSILAVDLTENSIELACEIG